MNLLDSAQDVHRNKTVEYISGSHCYNYTYIVTHIYWCVVDPYMSLFCYTLREYTVVSL